MIYIIVGTRPNYIKAFPIYKYFKLQNIDIQIIHSNQHYDNNLNKIFFQGTLNSLFESFRQKKSRGL